MMPNRPILPKQPELTRVSKAMQAAGVAEWRIEVEPSGKVVIIAGKTDAATDLNDWDAK